MSDLFGGGGGGSQPASQTVTQQNAVSAYAAPYVENMLGKAQALTNQPYQTYGGQRTADFTDLQNQAQQGAAGLSMPGQFGQASDLAGASGIGALRSVGQAGMYGGMGAGLGMQAANAGNQYNQMATNPYATQAFMSPYMQNVVDAQNREAARSSQMQGQQQQAEAVGRGTFGGSRDALMRAERERNLATTMNTNQATGLQNAFNQAQQAQQFGSTLGLQGLQAGIQGAQTGLQGVGAQQAGYGQAGQAGTNLANIGNQALGAQQSILNTQNQFGGQQQQQQQNILNQQYQDFQNQKQNPYNQLSFMQNMLAGLPMQSSVQNVYQNPSMLSQVAGLGTTALAGAKLAGYKKGGRVGSGLDDLGMYNATKVKA